MAATAKVIILPRDRLAWHLQLADDPELSHLSVRVGMIIGSHFNNRTGRTFVGYEGIAKRLGVERTAAWRAITKLRTRGHLDVISGGGRNVANEYRMVLKTVAPAQRFAETKTVAPDAENRCASATTTLSSPTGKNSTQPAEFFVVENSADADAWFRYLRKHRKVTPFMITHVDGRRGFWAPSPRPSIETDASKSADQERTGEKRIAGFDAFKERMNQIKLAKEGRTS